MEAQFDAGRDFERLEGRNPDPEAPSRGAAGDGPSEAEQTWKRLLVATVLPLEVLVASEKSDGPIREISPSLRAMIGKAVTDVREALAASPAPAPSDGPTEAQVDAGQEASAHCCELGMVQAPVTA